MSVDAVGRTPEPVTCEVRVWTGEAIDDLAGGGGELGQAGFGLGKGGGEALDLLAQVVGSCGGLIVFGPQQPQEFADVHAARSTWSRQVGVGVGEAAEHVGGDVLHRPGLGYSCARPPATPT